MCTITEEMLKEVSLNSNITKILLENYRYRKEACYFLLQEVKYGKLMCQVRKRKSKYFEMLEPRLELLEKALTNLTSHLEIAMKSVDLTKANNIKEYTIAFSRFLSIIDQNMSWYNVIIQDTANSITYRRYRNATATSQFQAQVNSSRMRLSEVHIDYPDTVRVVETLVKEYFSGIKKKYLPLGIYGKLEPPALVLARGRSLCFEPFCREDENLLSLYHVEKNDNLDELNIINLIKDDDLEGLSKLLHSFNIENLDRLKTNIKYMIQFSRIVAPRYFPVMIRYTPLLAHELSHALLKSAELIHHKSLDEIDWSKDNGFGILIKNFGSAMQKIIKHRLSLYKTLFTFLSDCKEEEKVQFYNGIGYNNNGIPKETVPEKTSAYITEIIADMFGLILGQQSYLIAFVFNGMISHGEPPIFKGEDTPKDRTFLSRMHPPMIVRLELLKYLSKELGFVHTLEKIKTFEKELYITEFGKNSRKIWEELWKKNWWEKEETRIAINSLAIEIRINLKCTPLYNRFLDGSDTGEIGVKFNESEMFEAFKVLNNHIDNNRLVWDKKGFLFDEINKFFINDKNNKDIKLRSSDLINVLIQNLLNESQENEGRKRMQWRLALRKNFEGDEYYDA